MGKYCFGIDVGGTSVKCGLFQTDGVLVEKWEIPTRKENSGEAILPDIAKNSGQNIQLLRHLSFMKNLARFFLIVHLNKYWYRDVVFLEAAIAQMLFTNLQKRFWAILIFLRLLKTV